MNQSTFDQFEKVVNATEYTGEEYIQKLLISNACQYQTSYHHIDQVNQYIKYQNMSEMYVCINSAIGPPVEPGNVPYCWPFQSDWTDEEEVVHGWQISWVSLFANDITGTDTSINKRHNGWQISWVSLFANRITGTDTSINKRHNGWQLS